MAKITRGIGPPDLNDSATSVYEVPKPMEKAKGRRNPVHGDVVFINWKDNRSEYTTVGVYLEVKNDCFLIGHHAHVGKQKNKSTRVPIASVMAITWYHIGETILWSE